MYENNPPIRPKSIAIFSSTNFMTSNDIIQREKLASVELLSLEINNVTQNGRKSAESEGKKFLRLKRYLLQYFFYVT